MVRAPALHAGGHWFESSTAHFFCGLCRVHRDLNLNEPPTGYSKVLKSRTGKKVLTYAVVWEVKRRGASTGNPRRHCGGFSVRPSRTVGVCPTTPPWLTSRSLISSRLVDGLGNPRSGFVGDAPVEFAFSRTGYKETLATHATGRRKPGACSYHRLTYSRVSMPCWIRPWQVDLNV